MASYFPSSLPAIFSPLSSQSQNRCDRQQLLFYPNKKLPSLFIVWSAENGAGAPGSTAVDEKKLGAEKGEAQISLPIMKEERQESVVSNGAPVAISAAVFEDPRWVGGTWDLTQFQAGGKTNWDAVIDAEARRRKWLEDQPEASSIDQPVNFDSSIIPWWAWIKRYHLPEAEILNGRAAMIGFFMAYFVDSLTGIGLVDQMGNFFCKTLLFVSVVGVMLVRENKDIEKLKKLIEEATFYDKQWQATWKEDKQGDSKNS
ncbi:hypothetical protein HPP92_014492 [Vanilla planifolia]|uniref:Uncharacterized protein n=1 Tax=Vanilla planifolia TaxID=51239 RepID=A0A835UWX9_VANPL|nr:hypothetical protein HPP92_014492 [Vanilla planifolia]